MFENKIKKLLNSESNPFIFLSEKTHEFRNIQLNMYEEVKPVFDLLFYFCEEKNINRSNPFELKDKFIFIENEYLYFISNPSGYRFALNDWKIITPQIRVKYSDIKEIYIFEYSYQQFEDENVKFTTIKDEKYDFSFNFMVFDMIKNVIEMLFDND